MDTNFNGLHKNADWATVQRDGKALFDAGNYEIIAVTQEVIDANIEGSRGDEYRTQIYFAPGSYEIGWYDCTCMWGQYVHGRKKFTDRPCKHAMALYYWFQSVGKGGLQKQKTSSLKKTYYTKKAGVMFTKDDFDSEYDSGVTTYFAKSYPWYAEIESSEGTVNYAVYNGDTIVARSEDYWMGFTNGMETAYILPTVDNGDEALVNINTWLAGKTAGLNVNAGNKTASLSWEKTPADVVNNMYGFNVKDPVYMAYNDEIDTEYLVYFLGTWTGVDIEMIGDGPTATFQGGDLFVDGLASAEEAMKSVEETEEWMRTANKKCATTMTIADYYTFCDSKKAQGWEIDGCSVCFENGNQFYKNTPTGGIAIDVEFYVADENWINQSADFKFLNAYVSTEVSDNLYIYTGPNCAEEAFAFADSVTRQASKKAQNAMTICQCCSKPIPIPEAVQNDGFCMICSGDAVKAACYNKIASRSFSYEERDTIEKEGENELARNRDKLYSNDATSLFM